MKSQNAAQVVRVIWSAILFSMVFTSLVLPSEPAHAALKAYLFPASGLAAVFSILIPLRLRVHDEATLILNFVVRMTLTEAAILLAMIPLSASPWSSRAPFVIAYVLLAFYHFPSDERIHALSPKSPDERIHALSPKSPAE